MDNSVKLKISLSLTTLEPDLFRNQSSLSANPRITRTLLRNLSSLEILPMSNCCQFLLLFIVPSKVGATIFVTNLYKFYQKYISVRKTGLNFILILRVEYVTQTERSNNRSLPILISKFVSVPVCVVSRVKFPVVSSSPRLPSNCLLEPKQQQSGLLPSTGGHTLCMSCLTVCQA